MSYNINNRSQNKNISVNEFERNPKPQKKYSSILKSQMNDSPPNINTSFNEISEPMLISNKNSNTMRKSVREKIDIVLRKYTEPDMIDDPSDDKMSKSEHSLSSHTFSGAFIRNDSFSRNNNISEINFDSNQIVTNKKKSSEIISSSSDRRNNRGSERNVPIITENFDKKPNYTMLNKIDEKYKNTDNFKNLSSNNNQSANFINQKENIQKNDFAVFKMVIKQSQTEKNEHLAMGQIFIEIQSENISKLQYFCAKLPKRDFIRKQTVNDTIKDSGKHSKKTNTHKETTDVPKQTIFDKIFNIENSKLIVKNTVKLQGITIKLQHDNRFDYFQFFTKVLIIKTNYSLELNLIDLQIIYDEEVASHPRKDSEKESVLNTNSLFHGKFNQFQNTGSAAFFMPKNKNVKEFQKQNNVVVKMSYYDSAADIKFEVQNLDFFVTIEGIDLLKSILKSFNDSREKFTTEEIFILIKKDYASSKHTFSKGMKDNISLKKFNSTSSKIITDKHIFNSRKPSESNCNTSFYSIEQSNQDEFFDAIEDEAEILCQKEINFRMEMFKNLGESIASKQKIDTESSKKINNDSNNEKDPRNEKFSSGFFMGNQTKKNSEVINEDPKNKTPEANSNNQPNSSDIEYDNLRINISGVVKSVSMLIYNKLDQLNFNIISFKKISLAKNTSNVISAKIKKITMVLRPSMCSLALRLSNNPKPENSNNTAKSQNVESDLGKKLIASSVNFEIDDCLEIYIVDDISSRIHPLLKINQNIKLNTVKNQSASIQLNTKLNVLNQDYNFLEPFLEDFSCKFNYSKIAYQDQEKTVPGQTKNHMHSINFSVSNFLVNIKPSILTCFQKIFSRIINNIYGMRVENASILRVRNHTGYPISCTSLLTFDEKLVEPNEEIELNISDYYMSSTFESEIAGGKLCENSLIYIKAYRELRKEIMRKISNFENIKKIQNYIMIELMRDVNESAFEINSQSKDKKNQVNFKKEIKITIPDLGINHLVDLEEVNETYCLINNNRKANFGHKIDYKNKDSKSQSVSNDKKDTSKSNTFDVKHSSFDHKSPMDQFLISGITLNGPHTVLTLNSNYFQRNNMDSPILFCLYKSSKNYSSYQKTDVIKEMNSAMKNKRNQKFNLEAEIDEIDPEDSFRRSQFLFSNSYNNISKTVETILNDTKKIPKDFVMASSDNLEELISSEKINKATSNKSLQDIEEKNYKKSYELIKTIYLEPGNNVQLDLFKNFPEDFGFKLFLPNSLLLKEMGLGDNEAEYQWNFNKYLNQDLDDLENFDDMISVEDMHIKKSRIIEMPLTTMNSFGNERNHGLKYNQLYLVACLSEIRENGEIFLKNDFSKVETEFSDDFTEKETLIKNEIKAQDTTKSNSKYCISINYPVTVQNCLPFDLNQKFMESSFINKENSTIQSKSGSQINYDIAGCFVKKVNDEHIQNDVDLVETAVKPIKHKKYLHVCSLSHPSINFDVNGYQSLSCMYIKKSDSLNGRCSTERSTLGTRTVKMQSVQDIKKNNEELDDIWNENRIMSLENEKRQSMNILIHTSKVFNMIRISITSQIWFLNELPYDLDIFVTENNYQYPKQKQPSSINKNNENKKSFDLKKIGKKYNFIKKYSTKDEISNLITFKKYINHIKNDISIQSNKNEFIKTFTGMPNDRNKTLGFSINEVTSKQNLSFKDLNNQDINNVSLQEFSGYLENFDNKTDNLESKTPKIFPNEKREQNLDNVEKIKVDFDCLVKSYQMPSECGAANLIIISPSYIIYNGTGQILKISQEYAAKDIYELHNTELYYVTWQSQTKQKLFQVEETKKQYFNYSCQDCIWTSGLCMKDLSPSEFYLKIGSLRKNEPRILQQNIEKVGNSNLIRVKDAGINKGQIIIKNNTESSYKVFQKDFELCSEYILGYSEKYFCWDDPFMKHQLVIQKVFNNTTDNLKLIIDMKGEYKVYSLYDEKFDGYILASITKGLTNSSTIMVNLTWRKVAKPTNSYNFFNLFPKTKKYVSEDPELPVGTTSYENRQIQQSKLSYFPLTGLNLYYNSQQQQDTTTNPISSDTWDFFINIDNIGISLNDNSPSEQLYTTIQGIRIVTSYNENRRDIFKGTFEILDIQSDFQINAKNNQVFFYTVKETKKRNQLSMWKKNRGIYNSLTSERALQPALKLKMNLHSNIEGEKSLSLKMKFANFAVNLNGYCFVKILKLSKKLNQQLLNIKNIMSMTDEYLKKLEVKAFPKIKGFSTQFTILEEKADDKSKIIDNVFTNYIDKVYVEISAIKINFMFENLGDLVNYLSKSNIAKFLGTFLVDILSFKASQKELSIIGMQYEKQELLNKIMVHYISQLSYLFLQVFPASDKLVNPVRLITSLTHSIVSVFQMESNKNPNKQPKNDPFFDLDYGTSKNDYEKTSLHSMCSQFVYSVFDAYSKMTGNFHHTVLRKFINDPLVFNSISNPSTAFLKQNDKEHRDFQNLGLFESITKKVGRLIHTALILPLATPFLPALVKERKLGLVGEGLTEEESALIPDNRNEDNVVPKRPPRFFYRNKILVPFSELKAKLQLILDNKDINKGFFFYISSHYVVLLTEDKFVLISKQSQRPILTQEYSAIFRVNIYDDKIQEEKSGVKEKYQKIDYYETAKFLTSIVKKEDPFVSSSKTVRFQLKEPQEKSIDEMKKKIVELDVEGFFFNY